VRITLRLALTIGGVMTFSSLLCAQPQAIPLAQFPDIVGIAASYNADDGFRTVIVARKNEEVRELFYKTSHGSLATPVGNSVVANIPGVSAVSSFYARDDGFRIVLAATEDGSLHEVFYHPARGKGQSVIGQFGSIRNLAGFYDPATRDRVAILLTGGPQPQIKELAYAPTTGKREKTLAQSSTEVTAMCASYYPGGASANRRIVTMTAAGDWVETFLTDAPFLNTLKQSSSQQGLGGTKSVACGKSGFIFADRDEVAGHDSWLPRISIQATAVALDSFDSTNVIVASTDGRVLLFVRP
jgi:hypothetical protein